MPQMNSLRVRSVSRGPICYFELNGVIEETFDPEVVVSDAPRVIINLRGVSRLTPFGGREFTSAMRRLGEHAEQVYLVQCSPAIVAQLRAVANFAGGAQVVSVNAPFDCESCGGHLDLTCALEPHRPVVVPEARCQRCALPMVFDGDPAAMLALPRPIAPHPLDFAVATFLRQLAQENGPADAAEDGPAAPSARSLRPPRPAPGAEHVPPSRLARMRPWMIGLSIPALVAAVITAAWPSGRGLPPPERAAFEADLAGGKYVEAREIIERARELGQLSATRASELRGVLAARALSRYGHLVAAGKFAESLGLIGELALERIIAPPESARLQREVTKAAVGRYRALAALRQYGEAEALARGLEKKDALSPALRATFLAEVGRERERFVAALHRDVLRAFEGAHYADALAAAKDLAIFGPLDAEATAAVAESNRRLRNDAEAHNP